MEKLRIHKKKMKDLVRLMTTLEAQIAKCPRCGMCQAVCPVYAVTGRETDSARGKLALLGGLMGEMFKDPDGVDARLDRCLLCGSCEAECPTKVPVLEVFLNARAILSGYRGLSSAEKLIFRVLLSHPAAFDRLLEWGAGWQKLFLKPAKPQADLSCGRLVSPLPSNRHLVPLAPVPFHKMDIPALIEGENKIRVAFFVGCLLDKVFPEVAAGIVAVLRHHGVTVMTPDAQGCCGIPALAGGDTLTFNQLVDHHLEGFNPEGYDYLVTGCATCTAVIKKIWPALAKTGSDEKQAMIRQISAKTYDISEFLVKVAGLRIPTGTAEGALKTVVTYHDPCHLRKTLKVYAEPRQIIKANPNCLLREMSNPSACCGMGGSFSLKHYDMSVKIGAQKASDIIATGASVVATGCPACMIQLKDLLAQAKSPVIVKHVITLYADACLLPLAGNRLP